MTAHGPALIQKAARALAQITDTPAADWQWAARAVLNAVADDLRAGALEEAADAMPFGYSHAAHLLREQAAEIRAGAS